MPRGAGDSSGRTEVLTAAVRATDMGKTESPPGMFVVWNKILLIGLIDFDRSFRQRSSVFT